MFTKFRAYFSQELAHPDDIRKPKDERERNSTSLADAPADGVKLTEALFRVQRRIVIRTHLWMFGLMVCLSCIVAVLASTVYELEHPLVEGLTCLALSCILTPISYLLVMLWSQGSVVKISEEGVESTTYMRKKRLSWGEMSSFRLYRARILSRLEIFDQCGRRRLIISGFYDCLAISTALEQIRPNSGGT